MSTLIDLPAHVGHVAAKIVWEVVTVELDVIGTVSPEHNAPTITMSTQANIIRTARGVTLRANDYRDLNPFQHRLRPVWVYEDGSRFPLGVFMMASPTRVVGSRHTLVDATLVDQGWMLDQPVTHSVGLWGNALIHDAIVQLVEQAGVTRHRVSYSDATTGGPLNWPVGTQRLTILRALCELAGLLPPYFDSSGVLVVRPPSDPVEGQMLSYSLDATSRIFQGTVAERDNILDAPNVYLVVGLSPGRSEIVGRAEIDPRLPHSIPNRGGLEVPDILRMQGIRSSTQAQQIAEARAARDPFQLATVSFSAAPDPRHDVFDLVAYDGHVWAEDQWVLRLDPSDPEHTHHLTRQVYGLPGGGEL